MSADLIFPASLSRGDNWQYGNVTKLFARNANQFLFRFYVFFRAKQQKTKQKNNGPRPRPRVGVLLTPIYNTASSPYCRVNSWNSLSALNSWTHNCLFLLPRKHDWTDKCKNYISKVILVILIHGLSLTLLAGKNNALQKLIFLHSS